MQITKRNSTEIRNYCTIEMLNTHTIMAQSNSLKFSLIKMCEKTKTDFKYRNAPRKPHKLTTLTHTRKAYIWTKSQQAYRSRNEFTHTDKKFSQKSKANKWLLKDPRPTSDTKYKYYGKRPIPGLNKQSSYQKVTITKRTRHEKISWVQGSPSTLALSGAWMCSILSRIS